MRNLVLLLVALSAMSGCLPQGASVLNRLPANHAYIVLMEGDNFITEVSRLVGFEGRYWHIEVVYNSQVYGCRPPVCSEISVSELSKKFKGNKATIRRFDDFDNPNGAITWFRVSEQGKAYDLFDKNCTNLVWELSRQGGVKKSLVRWTKTEEALLIPGVSELLVKNQMAPPKRIYILFPDAFTEVGEKVTRVKF